jgi:hypothetical protein
VKFWGLDETPHQRLTNKLVKFAKASEWRGKPKMTIKKKGKTVAKDDGGHKSSTGTTGGAAGNFLHVDTVWHPGVSPETYEQHRNILVTGETRRVYWGVIHDADYPEEYRFVLDKHLARLEEQISAAEDTYLFVDALDRRKDFLWGKIEEIRKGTDFPSWMEDERVPAYYKETVNGSDDTTIGYWFLLSDLRRISHSIFKKVRPIGFEEIDMGKYGKAGRPYPCACDFDGVKELIDFLTASNTEIYQAEKSVEGGDEEFNHSPDFSTVILRGRRFVLTRLQREVVKILWEAYKNGASGLSQKHILQQVANNPGHFSDSLKDIFRSTPRVMGGLIVRERRGIYRLNLKIPT